MIRLLTTRILNGRVIATEEGDWLDFDFVEAVKGIQRTSRNSYKDIVDTEDGVIHVGGSGLISIYAWQIKVD